MDSAIFSDETKCGIYRLLILRRYIGLAVPDRHLHPGSVSEELEKINIEIEEIIKKKRRKRNRIMNIILASASPRRRELLAQIGLQYEVKISDVEEKITSAVPHEIVEQLATQKAEAVFETVCDDDNILVIGADTIVACDGKVLGKPSSPEEAVKMLTMLQGRKHQVYTGVCVIRKRSEVKHDRETFSEVGMSADAGTVTKKIFHECTQVRFYDMSPGEIQQYVDSQDPLDKAGAYGIQGFCARYIAGIDGDYNNVVGLPVGRLYQEIKEWLED